MSQPSRTFLEAFAYLSNLAIFNSEKTQPKKIYIDTYDVIKMMLGWQSLFENQVLDSNNIEIEPDTDLLNSNRFFCQMLFFYGESGQGLSMLPNHLKELSIHLSRGFDPINISDSKVANSIFDHLHIIKKYNKSFSKLNDVEKEELVSRISRLSPGVFKAVVSMRPFEWKKRLHHLVKEREILSLGHSGTRFSEILQNPIYTKTLDALNNMRPEAFLRINNLNDASALCSLSIEIQKFKKGEIDEMPIFYDPHGFFSKVVDLAGLRSSFETKQGDSLLRSSEYFIIHSYFTSSDGSSTIRSGDIVQDISKSVTDLIEKRERLKDDVNALDSITHSNYEDIDNQVDKYLKRHFLKYTASEFYSKKLYSELLTQFESERKEAQNEDFKKYLNKELVNINNRLYHELKEFSEDMMLWLSISEAVRKHRGNPEFKNGIVGVLGLIRFALSIDIRERVEREFGLQGLSSGSDTSVRESCKLILSLASTNKSRPEYSYNIIVALSGLWILQLYKEIVKIASKSYKRDISIAIFYGAALSTFGHKNRERQIKVIQFLEDKLRNDPERKPQVMIGLAYLHYHLWVSEHEPFTLNEEEPYDNLNSNRAIIFAKESLDLLSNKRWDQSDTQLEMMWLYAYNIFCFYLIQAGSRDNFFKYKNKIDRFIQQKDIVPSLWNQRYDDTIARYYHRMSEYHSDGKTDYLNEAIAIMKRINKEIPDIIEFKSYYLLLISKRGSDI